MPNFREEDPSQKVTQIEEDDNKCIEYNHQVDLLLSKINNCVEEVLLDVEVSEDHTHSRDQR